MSAAQCAVAGCISHAAPGSEYCQAHRLLFATQDETAATKLLAALDAWTRSRFGQYPEERRRRGSGLWISPEDIRGMCRSAGAVDFATADGAHGLFVREFRHRIKALYCAAGR